MGVGIEETHLYLRFMHTTVVRGTAAVPNLPIFWVLLYNPGWASVMRFPWKQLEGRLRSSTRSQGSEGVSTGRPVRIGNRGSRARQQQLKPHPFRLLQRVLQTVFYKSRAAESRHGPLDVCMRV